MADASREQQQPDLGELGDVRAWREEVARLEAENERLREFIVDLAEGWVGDIQARAQRVLDGGE